MIARLLDLLVGRPRQYYETYRAEYGEVWFREPRGPHEPLALRSTRYSGPRAHGRWEAASWSARRVDRMKWKYRGKVQIAQKEEVRALLQLAIDNSARVQLIVWPPDITLLVAGLREEAREQVFEAFAKMAVALGADPVLGEIEDAALGAASAPSGSSVSFPR